MYKRNNEVMCSFNVSSLFTKIPINETIEICRNKLYALPDPPTMPRYVLKGLLEFATKSHFLFDEDYCNQIDGVAMSSPLGHVFANIFLPFQREVSFQSHHSPFYLVSIR